MNKSIFIDTINGIKRERPPVWFMRQAGRVLPSYLKLKENYTFHELMRDPGLAAEVTLLPVYDLGVDAAILFSDILVVPEALGMELEFTDRGPQFKKPISEIEDPVSSLVPDTAKFEHIYKAIDIIREKKPEETALIGFCGAPFTTFCYMVEGNSSNHTFSRAIDLLYKDKRTSASVFEAITEISIEYAVSQAKHGIDAFQLFDTHAGLIPSELYIEFILPYVKRISKAVREHNVPFIFFPKNLGLGLSEIGRDTADYLGIDWQASLKKAREIIDPKIGVQGNLEPRVLSASEVGTVERELTKFAGFGKENYNWIFNTGHGLLPDNSFENVKFTVDWIKQFDWGRS